MNKNEFAVFRDLGMVNIGNIDDFIKKHEISTGRFTNIYLGDFFTIIYDNKAMKFRIYGINSDKGCKKNHIVVVPDSNLEDNIMHSYYNTGFIGTKIFKEALPEVDRKLECTFGDHLLTTKVMLSDSSDTVKEYEVKSILMSEIEVFGKIRYSRGLYASKEEQLPLFKLLEDFCIKEFPWFWLRDGYKDSATGFCFCSGYSSYSNASDVHGVRPRIQLG